MASFEVRVLVVTFVLVVIWIAGRVVHADGPRAVMSIAALMYAVSEVIRTMVGR